MRMRTILLLSVISLTCGITSMSLFVLHSSLEKQIHNNLVADLSNSTHTFQNLQLQRQQMLDHEVDLLADLPSLKALMTSNDSNTIQDGGFEFWRVSGSDLFALMDASGSLAAVYSSPTLTERADLGRQLNLLLNSKQQQHYLYTNHRLYQVAFRPLYFGSDAGGTLLGSVVAGYALDERIEKQVREAASAEVIFVAADQIISSTLGPKYDGSLRKQASELSQLDSQDDIWLGKEHYLVASLPIPTLSASPVRLLVLKSFDQASGFALKLNRLLLGLGLVVVLVSTLLALYVSGTITRPLDALLAGARAIGSGNFDYKFTRGGARELNELSEAFDQMRNQLRTSQQELVESARLAIIGRMASSISHDLRHYLSAIYANAEFLSHPATPAVEREELMADVKLAVHGMTDVIESLLIFSRTGRSLHPSYESVNLLIERSVSVIRMHPDAQSVIIIIEPLTPITAWIDARMVERAICNLLINAVQSASKSGAMPGHPQAAVSVSLTGTSSAIEIRVTDNGPGVPESIQETLFEPFVSEGKKRGIGLGLTIASRVAQEHGGAIQLETSRPGRTVFVFSLPQPVHASPELREEGEPASLSS
jgi:signal transduction histidine kinase